MSDSTETLSAIEKALLGGASIRRVIDVKVAHAGDDLVVGAKVDLASDLTMNDVSVVLHQAKRRVHEAVASASIIYIEPDVWVDPNAVQPTTSAVVTLSYD